MIFGFFYFWKKIQTQEVCRTACENKHSPDKRSPVRELSGTGEAAGCGDENVSSRNERKNEK